MTPNIPPDLLALLPEQQRQRPTLGTTPGGNLVFQAGQVDPQAEAARMSMAQFALEHFERQSRDAMERQDRQREIDYRASRDRRSDEVSDRSYKYQLDRDQMVDARDKHRWDLEQGRQAALTKQQQQKDTWERTKYLIENGPRIEAMKKLYPGMFSQDTLDLLAGGGSGVPDTLRRPADPALLPQQPFSPSFPMQHETYVMRPFERPPPEEPGPKVDPRAARGRPTHEDARALAAADPYFATYDADTQTGIVKDIWTQMNREWVDSHKPAKPPRPPSPTERIAIEEFAKKNNVTVPEAYNRFGLAEFAPGAVPLPEDPYKAIEFVVGRDLL